MYIQCKFTWHYSVTRHSTINYTCTLYVDAFFFVINIFRAEKYLKEAEDDVQLVLAPRPQTIHSQ